MVETHRWPPLFKKATNGKILKWQIWVVGSTIKTTSGYLDGAEKESSDTLKAGKNIGRKNETTPHEQAILEAQSRLEKQIDRGYVWEMEDAEAGNVDESVGGSFYPMLAHTYDKAKRHIVYPCYVQPKLDGLRAVFSGGRFYSRTRKPFPVIKHLVDEIERLELDHLHLDGELYLHEFREDFEKLVSAIKREKTENVLTQKIEYHIYDVNEPGSFSLRLDKLEKLRPLIETSNLVKLVDTRLITDEEEMLEAYDDFMEQGYEGAMLRNLHGEYESKRSYHLQKVKQFQDDEFLIVGIEEGRGKLAGHVGAFLCAIDNDTDQTATTFAVKLKGDNVTEFLKRAFEDHSLWKGKWLKVQFQGYTRKNRVPRFPVGLHIRDAE